LPESLDEAARVRRELGYPIIVSPFARFVITQAVLNVMGKDAPWAAPGRGAQICSRLLWRDRGTD
jgi:hypothetical protein